MLSYRYATSPAPSRSGCFTAKAAGQQGYERSDGVLTLRIRFQSGCGRLQGLRTATHRHFRWSEPGWSPPPESNRRPHPQVKIPSRGGKLPGTYQGRRGPRPLRGAVNGPGAIACCPSSSLRVAAGHEPLTMDRQPIAALSPSLQVAQHREGRSYVLSLREVEPIARGRFCPLVDRCQPEVLDTSPKQVVSVRGFDGRGGIYGGVDPARDGEVMLGGGTVGVGAVVADRGGSRYETSATRMVAAKVAIARRRLTRASSL